VNHPALDAFGDLDAAARDPHVAGCERCRRELRDQLQVRDLLAALPDPGPPPADVVDRIQSTLRALAAEPVDTGGPEPAPDPHRAGTSAGSTVVPLDAAPSRRPRRPGRTRRPLFAVAAAAVLLTAGGYGLSQLVPSTSGADSSAAGAALHESSDRAAVPEVTGVRSIASGTDYTRSGLERQVDAVLASGPTAGLAGPKGPLANADGVAGCLAALGSADAAPVLVDVARFEGEPAAIVVLRAPGGTREVWVVSTTCRPGQDGMRYFSRLP
jgi:hypothetical protein